MGHVQGCWDWLGGSAATCWGSQHRSQHRSQPLQCCPIHCANYAPPSHTSTPSLCHPAGEGDLFDFGQECLDRIALSLGANTVAAAAGALLPVLLADPDWKQRHAALITIAQVAEGCVKVFVKQTDALTGLCLQVGGWSWLLCLVLVLWLALAAAATVCVACWDCCCFVVGLVLGPRCQAAQLTSAVVPGLIRPRVVFAGCERRPPQGPLGLLPGHRPAVHRPGPRPAGKWQVAGCWLCS